MFFNGAAIVVAVTLDALVTRRLQDALRRASRRGPRRAACRAARRPRARHERACCSACVVRWETLLVVAIIGVGIWSTIALAVLPHADQPARPDHAVRLHRPARARADVRRHRRRDRHLGHVDPRRLGRVVRTAPRPRAERLDRGARRPRRRGRARPRERRARRRCSNLPSLAVTLGTLAAFQGLAFVVLSGEGVAEFPQGYLELRRRLRPQRAARGARRPRRRAVVLGVRAARHPLRPLPVRDRQQPRGGAALRRPGRRASASRSSSSPG